MKKITQTLKKKEVIELLNKQLNSPKRFIISPVDLSLLRKRKIDYKSYSKDLKKVNANKTIYLGLKYTLKDLLDSGFTDTEIKELGYTKTLYRKKQKNKNQRKNQQSQRKI